MFKKGLVAMARENEKKEKQIGGMFQWDTDAARHIVVDNMIKEAERDYNWAFIKANFIVYRLKFADDKTIELMQDAIFNRKKHFTEKIAGKYTIYETMQLYGCDYFEALLDQYQNTEHAKKSKYVSECEMPWPKESYKLKCTELSEDGSHIVFMSKEDWEAKYGPVEVVLNDIDKNDQKNARLD
jgi:hypothetical protein